MRKVIILSLVAVCLGILVAFEIPKHPVASQWAISKFGQPEDCLNITGMYFYWPSGNSLSGKEVSGEILDIHPHRLASEIRHWNSQTRRVMRIKPQSGSKGFWHVAMSVPGMDYRAEIPSKTPPLFKRHFFQLSFYYRISAPHSDGYKEVWWLDGPLQGELYRPLRNLLSGCVLVVDPDHPNIKPELDVPVIEGRGKNGKDIIAMKPLITKFVKSDGDPIQVFTGNPKEDKYFDKKFNQP